MKPWTDEQRAEWDKWLNERPEAIHELARDFPPNQCLTMGGRGHYTPISYGEEFGGGVSMTLAHGDDSFMPGVAVFGIRRDHVRVCGCGKWEWPSKESVAKTKRHVDAVKQRRMASSS